MKQVTHTQRDGTIRVSEVPPPALRPNGLLVRTAYSLISAGTERSKVEVAKKGLIGKALARPDQVRQLVESARQVGLAATFQKVTSRLDALSPLGYCSAGVVIGVGANTSGFSPGDRVACGGETASHAEVIYVPLNLCVRIPDAVALEEGAFTTLGAIALQGLRQAAPSLSETVGVIGLGLLGLISVQLLRSAGCRVVGVDPDAARRELAERFGADVTFAPGSPDADRFTRRVNAAGLDAVIITAATKSNEPLELAGRLSRDRGRVVIVGAVRVDIPRSPFYEKELEVRLSRSYGPGRYDPQYEDRGIDYPIGYVRWTEGRNMAAFVDLLSQGKLDLKSLITHRFLLSDAERAYTVLEQAEVPSLGVLLDHELPQAAATSAVPTAVEFTAARTKAGKIGVAFIGAGNFAQSMLLPHLSSNPRVQLRSVATRGGLTARSVGERAGFETCSTDIDAALSDPSVDLVLIASRHDSHGELAAASLRAGKSVFVEKPLAISEAQMATVVAAHRDASERSATDRSRPPFLMVGFNRRFQPLVKSMREFIHQGREPLLVHYRVNAGYIPREHWTQDRDQGGGRIIGESCHFIDLVLHLVGGAPREVHAHALPDQGRYSRDNLCVLLKFEDGSGATISYASNGDRALEKERIEVFGGGRCAVLEDFRRLTLMTDGKRKVIKSGPDKGHRHEMNALVEAIASQGPPPIPFEESVLAMKVTFAVEQSLATGIPVTIAWSAPA